MSASLIHIIVAMGAAFISYLIISRIDKDFRFLICMKQKLHLNNSFKSILFIVLIWCLVDIILSRFTSTTTVIFYLIEGSILGILLLFNEL